MRVVVRCGFGGDRCPTFHASDGTTVGDIKQLLVEAKQTTIALKDMLLVYRGDKLDDEVLIKSLVEVVEAQPIHLVLSEKYPDKSYSSSSQSDCSPDFNQPCNVERWDCELRGPCDTIEDLFPTKVENGTKWLAPKGLLRQGVRYVLYAWTKNENNENADSSRTHFLHHAERYEIAQIANVTLTITHRTAGEDNAKSSRRVTLKLTSTQILMVLKPPSSVKLTQQQLLQNQQTSNSHHILGLIIDSTFGRGARESTKV